jgi:hypothetical protein
MNFVELDSALQKPGWRRVNLTTWSLPPRLITRLDARPADPWVLRTIPEVGSTTHEFFVDAEAVSKRGASANHRTVGARPEASGDLLVGGSR